MDVILGRPSNTEGYVNLVHPECYDFAISHRSKKKDMGSYPGAAGSFVKVVVNMFLRNKSCEVCLHSFICPSCSWERAARLLDSNGKCTNCSVRLERNHTA